MTNRGQSKLWRRLGATAPLFEVAAQDGWDDDTIGTWSASRGSDGGLYGVRANTAAVTVPGLVAPSRDQNLTIRLTAYGAALLEGLVGNRTAAQLAPRYLGRVAQQKVTDTDDDVKVTTLTCADWLTLIAGLGRTGQVDDNLAARLWRLHTSPITRANLDTTQLPAIVTGPGPWPKILDKNNYDEVPFDTIAGRYGADVAVTDFTHRDGTVTIQHRGGITPAATNHDPATHEPLTRRQCLSPADWSSTINAPARFEVTYMDGATTQTAINAPFGVRTFRTEKHVRTYMDDNNARTISALASIYGNPHNEAGYFVEEVTIDVAALLASSIAADRRLAGQLLTAELWDYVVLAYDWPEELQGFHYLTAITETVTPSEWRLTLSLSPDRHAVGMTILADYAGTSWATAHPDTTDWTTPTTDWSA